MNDLGIIVGFSRADFTPSRFVGHAHLFGGLIDGTGLNDSLKQLHASFGYHDPVAVINNAMG
jgi:hypothetical protein